MKNFLFLFRILSLLFISECANKESSTIKDRVEEKYFLSVQEYTGEGYTLAKGERNGEIAEEHSEEVDRAVKQYFKRNYHTKVKVHSIVGAVDGAIVFVESVGKPHFYSYAIISVDQQSETVDSTGVWSQEGQVGAAISSGLYTWIYEDEFQKLDQYLDGKVKEYPVVGISEEANQNGVGNYHTTPYYKVVIYGGVVQEKLLNEYLENSDLPKDEWVNMLEGESINPAMVSVLIQLYMEEPGVEPNKEIFDQIVSDLSDMDGLPIGKYSFLLHDNTVDKTNGQNNKENTLERKAPDYIIKR
ncbi:DUF1672 family protein [Anaerobacillus sp. 1_MG-2023]|uniref:DUF1672 family protein n=1 Tax=Anaerobacillus sp. 1_MG-2023 TaxID=3062655 RepID=UPI0026E16348|nr:DUF1672 family protein [Anaerobacillus sp. 1_MG-2023]MDO6657785.1 DUF1672 family protein [Anaerobacillus sp. 1_MG-2023]